MHVTFTNPQTGEQKTVKQGFSWVLLLFAPFYGIPLLIRGLHLHGAVVALIGVVGVLSPQISALVPLAGLGLIGAMVFYGIKGNKLTMAQLERKGWVHTSPGIKPTPAAPALPGAEAGSPLVEGDKSCTRCAETVKAAAVVCRHCGFEFGSPIDPNSATPAPKSRVLKIAGIAGAVLVGLIILSIIVGPPDVEPAGQELGDSEEVAAAETESDDSDLASAILDGDSSVCGTPEMMQKVRDYLENEAALVRAYPDVDLGTIRKVVGEAKIELPPAMVGGVRPDLGVVVCTFGRMAIKVQATADGEQVRLSPANSTTATNLIIFRAVIDRDLQKHRRPCVPARRSTQVVALRAADSTRVACLRLGTGARA